ncbi:MAG: hypothetical protein SO128_07625 [Clostridium cadaveris]|uniref:Uncharacterized protein n=1 Tax=Clostridium cadaveris TaxID=1529 RepID=A0A1I2L7R0_9CLOT|nr:hypothetical protein [Clostridium cadaveris]MDU4951702.1 hypothetical protein [Clostridium sp.]MDM8311319.1 hypothetical protein [Clostridium cadaveris]MDY4949226.1 hypothetical protein [Clostridium cadaveris]NME64715.1 hypothetical protein [Clostridium cadaveris]SFF75245.1 hypothetical protein SAMN04487885_10942 [Clostridium cadaveris]
MNQIVQPIIRIGLFLLIAWIVFPLIGFVFQIVLALVLAFLLYKFIRNLLKKPNLNKNSKAKNKNVYNSENQNVDNDFNDDKKVIDVDYKDVE